MIRAALEGMYRHWMAQEQARFYQETGYRIGPFWILTTYAILLALTGAWVCLILNYAQTHAHY